MSIQISFLMHFTSYVFLNHFYFCSIIWWRLMAIAWKHNHNHKVLFSPLVLSKLLLAMVVYVKKRMHYEGRSKMKKNWSFLGWMVFRFWVCLWIHITRILFFFFFEEALQGFLLSVSMNTHYECLGKLFLENININVCNNALPLYILKTNCN